MGIKVPAAELDGAATALRTKVAPCADAICTHATTADQNTDGILHQGAASMVEAVAQKLGNCGDLGEAAVKGLATGLNAVADAFGTTDRKLAGK